MTKLQVNYLKACPSWLLWSLLETYVKETPGPKSTQRILDYFTLSGITLTPNDATAFCAIGLNAAFEFNGIPGTKSAAALSFSRDAKKFVKLAGPALGAVAVWKRGDPKLGQGHCGLYVGEANGLIYSCGFNQSDAVNITPFPRKSKGMEFVGYYWPAGLPLPELKAVSLGASPGFDGATVT